MGHQRLGTIPTSRKWSAVVAELTGGLATSGGTSPPAAESVGDISLKDCCRPSRKACGGPSTTADFASPSICSPRWFWRPENLTGERPSASWASTFPVKDASVFDLTAGIQQAIDERIEAGVGPTEVSEIAQQAAGEAVASLAGPRAATLFGSGQAELQEAVRGLSTKGGFSDLGQRFFGCFMARFLNFYLSRITAGQVGGRIVDAGDLGGFNDALRTHCLQSARIVHDFCGEWYSKTEFQKGIDLDNTSGFMAVALRKLEAELRRQREGA